LGILTLYYSFPLLSNNNNNKPNYLLRTSLLGTTSFTNDKDSLQLRRKPEFQYVFWLLPAEPYRQELQRFVNELASEYHTIPFEPHITLAQPVPTHQIPNPRDALDRLAETAATSTTSTTSIVLNNFHVTVGQLYTQSVFLQFEENVNDPEENKNSNDDAAPNSLRSQYQALRDLYMWSRQISGLPVGEPNGSDHFPHMSLIYQNIDMEARKHVAATVRQKLEQSSVFFQGTSSIAFDAIQLVQIQLPVESEQDVQKWKTIGKRFLKNTQA
jgi:hypothetical protein